MKDKTIGLLGIGSFITIVESLGISMGIDGQMFATAVAALVGIFCYFLGSQENPQ